MNTTNCVNCGDKPGQFICFDCQENVPCSEGISQTFGTTMICIDCKEQFIGIGTKKMSLCPKCACKEPLLPV